MQQAPLLRLEFLQYLVLRLEVQMEAQQRLLQLREAESVEQSAVLWLRLHWAPPVILVAA